jgi:hypothetical protein
LVLKSRDDLDTLDTISNSDTVDTTADSDTVDTISNSDTTDTTTRTTSADTTTRTTTADTTTRTTTTTKTKKILADYVVGLQDFYIKQHQELLANYLNIKNPTGAEPIPDCALINHKLDQEFEVLAGGVIKVGAHDQLALLRSNNASQSCNFRA